MLSLMGCSSSVGRLCILRLRSRIVQPSLPDCSLAMRALQSIACEAETFRETKTLRFGNLLERHDERFSGLPRNGLRHRDYRGSKLSPSRALADGWLPIPALALKTRRCRSSWLHLGSGYASGTCSKAQSWCSLWASRLTVIPTHASRRICSSAPFYRGKVVSSDDRSAISFAGKIS
jgi:hypothetical protein